MDEQACTGIERRGRDVCTSLHGYRNQDKFRAAVRETAGCTPDDDDPSFEKWGTECRRTFVQSSFIVDSGVLLAGRFFKFVYVSLGVRVLQCRIGLLI